MRLSRIRVMTQSSQGVSQCLTESPGEAVNEAVKSEWWAAVNSIHLPSAPGLGARRYLASRPLGEESRLLGSVGLPCRWHRHRMSLGKTKCRSLDPN